MMKMATGDDFPLRQDAGTGSRLVFVATEACGGGTSDLSTPLGFWNIWNFIGQRVGVGGHRGVHNPPGNA